jgi:hypothetical protein
MQQAFGSAQRGQSDRMSHNWRP